MRLRPLVTPSLLFSLLLAVPAPSPAGEPGAPSPGRSSNLPPAHDRLLESGANLWGVFGSYGIAQTIANSKQIDITTVGFRWSHLYGKGRNHPAFAVELIPFYGFDQEPRAWGSGFNLLYEHHFDGGRVIPVLQLGAGALYANRKVPPGETRHNFSLLLGLVLRYPAGRNGSMEVGYRLHHVSNADTGYRNPGINAHTLMLGYTFR